ncbi:MAG TPA: hypothetical protein P5154_04975 [Candidatus Izemoplasmatales bacterium]|nr:hypothetical protein [Bacillota bacterium]HRY78099.1 hypothetical protein [Candidatus Izemoplasmatales bacterium]
MPWYGWVLIGVGVVALGVLKWWFGKQWMAKRREQAANKEKIEKEEE